jgi:hypothetical protein
MIKPNLNKEITILDKKIKNHKTVLDRFPNAHFFETSPVEIYDYEERYKFYTSPDVIKCANKLEFLDNEIELDLGFKQFLKIKHIKIYAEVPKKHQNNLWNLTYESNIAFKLSERSAETDLVSFKPYCLLLKNNLISEFIKKDLDLEIVKWLKINIEYVDTDTLPDNLKKLLTFL